MIDKMRQYPKPEWRPEVVSPIEWTIEHTRPYLRRNHGTIFANGSCVMWPSGKALSEEQCKERLLAVVTDYPTFTVNRNLVDSHFLATFRGGVGGIVSAKLLEDHLAEFREQAYAKGQFPSENLLRAGEGHDSDDRAFIAGLYVRAQLYLDVEMPVVVCTI